MTPDLQTPHALPDDRKFGWLFVAVFLLLAAYLDHVGLPAAAPAACLGIAALLAAASLAAPHRLAPLNRAWFALGLLLGRIVNPLVLGLLFYLLITPVALVQRLAGRDALRLRGRGAASHWVPRSPPGPGGDSFKNQF